jgi:hypothetical protein
LEHKITHTNGTRKRNIKKKSSGATKPKRKQQDRT